ncbi:high-affinity Cu transporter CTR3, partial [Ascoidea rubescens DSM 1968]
GSSCKMSMLWNWYSIDTCLISRTWKNDTKAKFAGSCVGVFFLLIAVQWFRRVMREYKRTILQNKKSQLANTNISSLSTKTNNFKLQSSPIQDFLVPILSCLSHNWFWALNSQNAIVKNDNIYIYPNVLEHIFYCALDTIEWSVHHVVMLLFMYFNGYIFISCMVGAMVGYFLFHYEPMSKQANSTNDEEKRCCR